MRSFESSSRKAPAMIRVQVDQDLADLIPAYIANRHKDLEKMWVALDQNAVEVIRFMNHQIRGHAKSYGFMGLHLICLKISESYDQPEALAECLEEIEQYLKALVVEIRGRK
jgi:hypothetical protein